MSNFFLSRNLKRANIIKTCKHRYQLNYNGYRSLTQFNHTNFSSTNKPSAFEQCIGNTPLLFLKSASDLAGCNVYGKAEFMNPGGSIKDRAALWMIREAESNGDLIRGEPGIIVEGTAGNTGIGLALASSIFGYECIIVIARTQTKEKKDCLRQAGAKLIEVDAVPYADNNHYVKFAERLATNLSEISNKSVLYANQWDNLANKRAHIEGTGPEIWNQLSSKLNVFNCAVGTGGTLSGVGTFLRMVSSNSKDIQICLTDPKGAALHRYYTEGVLKSQGSSISEGIGQGRLTGQLDGFKPDHCFEIDDVHMMYAIHELQQKDGLMVGLSTGINVAGSIKCAHELKLNYEHNIVTILCDLSQRYTTKQFNVPFLNSQNLPTPPWYDVDAVNKDNHLLEAVEKSYM